MRKISIVFVICVFFMFFLSTTVYASENALTYTPYYGNVYFYTSNNERYARINVRWNSAGLTEFNSSNDTYEQELVFYNYDNAAYALSCSSVYQTNIPNSYLDTQLFDNGNEANLAIGTTSATDITAGTLYYYIFNLTGGNGTESMYKISSQEGHYIFVPNVMTVFADSTTHLIPFKNGYTAPETRSWYMEVEPNGSTSVADTRPVNSWLSGVLDSDSDEDYSKIYLSGMRTIRFVSPSGTDYDVSIYNSSGELVTGLYSASSEQIISYTFTSGYYYFKVYSYSGSSVTDVYRLIIESDFSEPRSFPADINGDGRSDVVISRNLNGKRAFTVYLGTYDGTFSEPITSTSTRDFVIDDPVFTGDVNGDGRADMIIHWVNEGKRQLLVYTANSDGSINEGVNLASSRNHDPYTWPCQFFIADVNGDGKDDFIVHWKNSSGKRCNLVYKGKSSSPFLEDATVNALESTNNYIESDPVFTGDVNGDGRADMIIHWVNEGKRQLLVYTANSDGTYNTGINYSSTFNHDPINWPCSLYVATVNSDNRADFIVKWNDNYKNAFITYLGTSNGSFSEGVNSIISNPVPFYN